MPNPGNIQPEDNGRGGTAETRIELSMAGVHPEDVAAHDFDLSSQKLSQREEQPPPSKGATRGDILDDLRRTAAIQEIFTPSSITSIGQGGMGIVVSALDIDLQREQAIKVLKEPPTPVATARFKGEAQAIASLNHKNLVKIYRFGVSEAGRPYFVMDLVKDAVTLETAIEKYFDSAVDDVSKVQWRSRDKQLMRFFLETLDAVAYLHDHSIIHHDLKPANILISTDKEVFVTDFGLSIGGSLNDPNLSAQGSTQGSGGRATGFRGTVRYAAPEQLHGGEPITVRTDVYQLGLILRHLVLNEAPFEKCPGASVGEVLRQIKDAADPISLYGDPLAINPALPPELVAIIHKALQRNPLDRYKDAREFKEDLEAFLDGREVQAFSSGLSVPQRWGYRARVGAVAGFTWIRTNPGIASGIVAAGASLVGTGWVVIDRQNSAAEARIAAVERQNRLEILAAEIASDRELAARLLEHARLAEKNGNIDAAVNIVQPELLEGLKIHTHENDELNTLVETLEREHQARTRLVKMRDLEIGGYAAAVSGTAPGTLGEFDTELLLSARECLLPKGLTREGIEEFDQMMRSAHFSQEQRREIAAAITQLSLCTMVSEHGKHPWDTSLPVEVRQQLAEECDRIAQACTACRVEIEGNHEEFAVPNAAPNTKFMIEASYLPNVQPPIFKNGYFVCDSSLALLYAIHGWKAGSGSMQEIKIPVTAAERALKIKPEGFLDNVLYSHIILKAPDNNDPVLRYKHLHNALDSLMTAYGQARASNAGHDDLALQIFALIRQVAQASQAVPQVSRPELMATIIRASTLFSSDDRFVHVPEAQSALAILGVLQGVPSEEIAKTGRSLRNNPEYERDAVWITVLCDIYRSQPLNAQDAAFLLNDKFPERAPILTAMIYTRLGRHEEAIQLLEQLVRKNPDWRVDVERMRPTYLKPLAEQYGARFLDLTAVAR